MASTVDRTRVGAGVALLGGIVLLALLMRAPIVALSPVATPIRADLGISEAQFGLFTSVPVLCFGLTTPLALFLIRRGGARIAVYSAIAAIAVAIVIRSYTPFPAALASTVLLGIGITIGNVLVPVLIRSDFPARRRTEATGIYTVALNVGTMIAASVTVPLSAGLGWRGATAAWAAVGVAAAVAWILLLNRRSAPVQDTAAPGVPLGDALRNGPTWLLAAAFCGQAFSYYGMTTWLPTMLVQRQGLDPAIAGTTAGIFQISAVVGALGVPVLAPRTRPIVPLIVVGVLWILFPLGTLLAPAAYIPFTIAGGAAQGGGFVALLTIAMRVARESSHAAFVSAFMQGVGYCVGAVAPPLLGALRRSTGSWDTSLVLVLCGTLLFLMSGLAAARARPA